MIVFMPEQRAPLIYAARAAIVEIVACLFQVRHGVMQALRIHWSRIPLLRGHDRKVSSYFNHLASMEISTRPMEKRGQTAQDDHMMTPLSYATQEGRAGLVALMLQHGDVDVHSEDFCGTTPLAHATISKTKQWMPSKYC